MTTMTHQYFATWFYDDETIEYILDKNKIVEINEETEINAINKELQSGNAVKYENEYERAILERDPKNNDYKIIEISDKKFDGYLVAVYDPSRIKTLVTEKLGTSGQYVTTMAKNKNALIAINGGGFYDRYLEAHPNMKKIAFAFEFQMFESVPFEIFDRQPEKITTEKRIII